MLKFITSGAIEQFSVDSDASYQIWSSVPIVWRRWGHCLPFPETCPVNIRAQRLKLGKRSSGMTISLPSPLPLFMFCPFLSLFAPSLSSPPLPFPLLRSMPYPVNQPRGLGSTVSSSSTRTPAENAFLAYFAPRKHIRTRQFTDFLYRYGSRLEEVTVWFQANQRSASIPYRHIPSQFEPWSIWLEHLSSELTLCSLTVCKNPLRGFSTCHYIGDMHWTFT